MNVTYASNVMCYSTFFGYIILDKLVTQLELDDILKIISKSIFYIYILCIKRKIVPIDLILPKDFHFENILTTPTRNKPKAR